MKKYIFGAFILIFALSSCANPNKIAEKVEFRGFAGAQVKGVNEITLRFDIENRSNRNINLKEGELRVEAGSRTIAKASAADIVIGKRSSGIVELPLKVSLNQMAMLSLMGKKAAMDGMTVSGSIRISSGVAAKTFTIEDMPLMEFLDRFGMDEEILSKTMKLR